MFSYYLSFLKFPEKLKNYIYILKTDEGKIVHFKTWWGHVSMVSRVDYTSGGRCIWLRYTSKMTCYDSHLFTLSQIITKPLDLV